MSIYVVQPGDTVDEIAERYAVQPERIIYDNQLNYPYPLAVGQALWIGEDSGTLGTEERPMVLSGGYAYPFIQEEVLDNTLPYLSQLYIFSYGFTVEGELVEPAQDDLWMIQRASWAECAAILTLTPLGADGTFNNDLITAVVQNEAAKNNLYQNLLNVLQTKGYQGVDVDFEYIKAQDRDAFTEFVRGLRVKLGAFGYQVSVALAPKTSADQPGLLYQGKDYAGLGAAADRVLLMTYEWGYTYGPPMAVAPLNKVRQVVEYAVTEIPVDKINLGIPNYGYDWPLPFERGVTKAKTIGNIEAVQIAIEKGAEIQYDTVAQSPFFTYTENGVEHEVWFEDVRSIREKFNLMDEFGIHGTGYWQLMRLFRANWLLMESRYDILKYQ